MRQKEKSKKLREKQIPLRKIKKMKENSQAIYTSRVTRYYLILNVLNNLRINI